MGCMRSHQAEMLNLTQVVPNEYLVWATLQGVAGLEGTDNGKTSKTLSAPRWTVVEMIRIQARHAIEWKVFRGSSGPYVADCSSLRLTVQSETWRDLMSDIENVMQCLIEDLVSEDNLDAFAQEHGWEVEREPLQVPEPSKVSPWFDIPYTPMLVPGERLANGVQAVFA